MMSQLVLLPLCVGTSAPGGTRRSSLLVVRQVDDGTMNMSSTNWRWLPLDGTVTTGSFLLALDAIELFLQSAHLRLVCIFRQGRPQGRHGLTYPNGAQICFRVTVFVALVLRDLRLDVLYGAP